MKIVFCLLLSSFAFAQKPVPVIPASSISREKAQDYLKVTRQTETLEARYKAEIARSGASPSEEVRKKQLGELQELQIRLVQKNFAPLSMDAFLAFLKTPGGERWVEDASTYNEAVREELGEKLLGFVEELKEVAAEDRAAKLEAAGSPAGGVKSAPAAGNPSTVATPAAASPKIQAAPPILAPPSLPKAPPARAQ